MRHEAGDGGMGIHLVDISTYGSVLWLSWVGLVDLRRNFMFRGDGLEFSLSFIDICEL